jgi:prephenate dehydrogenase
LTGALALGYPSRPALFNLGAALKHASENLNLAGQGLRDLTRLASADATLWSQILTENHAAIATQLDLIIDDLNHLKQSITSNNSAAMIEFFNKGNNGKSKIPGKHGAKNRDYSYLPIVIDDKPGELARIFNECAKVSVNIEDKYRTFTWTRNRTNHACAIKY